MSFLVGFVGESSAPRPGNLHDHPITELPRVVAAEPLILAQTFDVTVAIDAIWGIPEQDLSSQSAPSLTGGQ
jgi:hypothetical protein